MQYIYSVKSILRVAVLVFATFTTFASAGGSKEKVSKSRPVFGAGQFNIGKFSSEIVLLLNSIPSKERYSPALKAFYQKNAHQPKWYKEDGDLSEVDTLLSYLNRAEIHGLSPERFYAAKISAILDTLNFPGAQDSHEFYGQLARLDMYCSKAVLAYTSAIRFGAVDADVALPNQYIRRQAPLPSFLQQILELNASDALKSVQITAPGYRALSQAYQSSQDERKRAILAVNMERIRWHSADSSEKYIEVNLPEYRLRLIRGFDTLVSMRVCIGRPFKTGHDYRTPLISGQIKAIQLNPQWTVPRSIALSEMLPKMVKDKHYLEKKQIELYRNDIKVSTPSAIDFSKLTAASFPYTLKQKPGVHNAMGRYKFVFDNTFSIFLHDTNNKAAFSSSRRAISHGCIRLQQPGLLAKALLTGTKGKQKLNKNFLETGNSEVLTLGHPVPIIFTYQTATFENDHLVFHEDIYQLDKYLVALLRRPQEPRGIGSYVDK